jgi:TfoX/Sxy family transcriptional regulator of competence genes
VPHAPLFEQRIANALAAHGVEAEPKRMFGGVAFMVNGHMSLGLTNKNELMVRFDGERLEEILHWPGAKPMTYGHKNMKGFVFVEARAVSTKGALDKWVKLSLAYVDTLPPKTRKPLARKPTIRRGR